MKISIIGAGHVGSALGTGWARRGHEIIFGVRNPKKTDSATTATIVPVMEAAQSSGVIVLAVRHGLPCIFTREGVIGYLGRKFAVGPEIDPDNIQTVVEALRRLTMMPQQYSRSLAEARQRFAVHDIEYFRSVISQTAISAIPS